LDAKTVFDMEFSYGRNMMTPNVIYYRNMDDKLFIELSTGKGIYDENIYGVTVLERKEDGSIVRRQDLSECFQSRGSAEEHIANLIEEFNHER
jgi:hypothetical protein